MHFWLHAITYLHTCVLVCMLCLYLCVMQKHE